MLVIKDLRRELVKASKIYKSIGCDRCEADDESLEKRIKRHHKRVKRAEGWTCRPGDGCTVCWRK